MNSDEDDDVLYYKSIVGAFANQIAEHIPAIGDCDRLAHSKEATLYAIAWVREYLQRLRDDSQDPSLCEKCEELIDVHNFLLTHLARDWHQINPEDKAAVARLQSSDDLPSWEALIRAKYIDEERARTEAVEATCQAIMDHVERVDRCLKEQVLAEWDREAEAARKRLKERVGNFFPRGQGQ